jgi:hypothetical protein
MRRCVLALALAGCATAQVSVPAEQASSVERELRGEQRFLKVSMYVTPFFGDTTRRLLTPVPPDEVRLLENPDGTPMSPGAVEQIVPAGTPLRIVEVEFPTAVTMTQRMLYTPRTLVWVRVEFATVKSSRPLVLVLRPGLRTADELRAEVSRALTSEDPRARLEALPDPVREAVRTKTAVVDMSADALEMAWGWPESRRIELIGTSKHERWSWPNKRSATLIDGRVTELQP